MTKAQTPPVVYEIIDIPSHLEIKHFGCKIAWQVMEDIPSLKFSESSTTSDEEFECRENSRAVSQNDLQHEKTVEEDNFNEDEEEEEEEDEKSEDLFSVEEHISYSDIIFSVPKQRHEDNEGDYDKSHDEKDEEDHQKEQGLQTMLLDNYVMEDKKPKKCLSRKRIRKSLSTEISDSR